jgi:hypothetical protein
MIDGDAEWVKKAGVPGSELRLISPAEMQLIMPPSCGRYSSRT